MAYYDDYDDVVKRLKSGEKLDEGELKTLVYDGFEVDTIEGDRGRWTQHMKTIIDIDNELWAIDWQQGLTEYQESSFDNQPYRVAANEKHIVVTEYVKVED